MLPEVLLVPWSVAIVVSLFREAFEFVRHVELASLWTLGWFPRRNLFDVKTLFVGSLIVTGIAMTTLMPPLLEQLSAQTGATFEMIATTNSLFGNTVTTAGLLVGADIRRALTDRTDLDLALIPAETINQDGIFLDDETFIAVRESLPMPVYPSYDFIDVLEQEGASAGLAAGGAR